jgi:hypothetical protein
MMVTAGHRAGETVDVRQQPVAQLVEGELGVVGEVALVTEVPHLPGWELAVDAEQRAEGPELEPAGEELSPLLDVRGFRVAARPAGRDGEAADIGSPVGDPRKAEVEPGGDLPAEALPVRGDVSRPGGGGVALRSGEGGAGEDEDPLIGSGGALAFVDRLAVDQREGVRHP